MKMRRPTKEVKKRKSVRMRLSESSTRSSGSFSQMLYLSMHREIEHIMVEEQDFKNIARFENVSVVQTCGTNDIKWSKTRLKNNSDLSHSLKKTSVCIAPATSMRLSGRSGRWRRSAENAVAVQTSMPRCQPARQVTDSLKTTATMSVQWAASGI